MEYYGRRRPSAFGYFLSAFFGAVIGGFLLLTFAPEALFQRFQVKEPEKVEVKKEVVYETVSTDVTKAAEEVIPSVVGIKTTRIQRSFFQNKRVQGVGSGIIIDNEGYILTNNHVAGYSSTNIVVSLYDGREVNGRVVWADEVLDLAIVKIDEGNLNVARLGDSKNVKIGEPVIAIGNPLGLTFQRTVTAGIISALNRTIEISEGVFMEDLIQTDASINPGNSGGPLVSTKGEVIGINTVKVTTAEGIGFAVPINIIKPIINSIKATGKFETPSLGIKGFDKNLAGYFDFKIEKGIYVYDVLRASPAARAGIKEGDVIVSINGKEVNTMMELKEEMFKVGVGGTLTITIKTPVGTTKNVEVKL
ncbi:S1C family serine protease [Caloramator sp. ALD01]|uniref:S1C family serine protease n=1 Tax=Caloramator sp. ALD01 TaxID=1031288 RepID=UPI0003FEF548|nr:trypsin-like peptidase domain-containing protein [Caloramator sp. ALD01]